MIGNGEREMCMMAIGSRQKVVKDYYEMSCCEQHYSFMRLCSSLFGDVLTMHGGFPLLLASLSHQRPT